nr:long-chain-fatty-acid--coa ligase 2 [Quercus suber]
MTIVTAYDTLGEEGLTHSLKQSRAKAIYTDPTLLPKLLKPLAATTNIKHIIYDNNVKVDCRDIDGLKARFPLMLISSIEELRHLGETNPIEAVKPKPDDLACIMYTSGTTSTPKGVLIKHRSVVAGVAGATPVIGQYLGPGDSMVTFLPLAHIFEFIFEHSALFWGVTLGYGNKKTLTDNSVRNCKGDLRELRPTLLIGVPQLWETIKKAIFKKLAMAGPIKARVFWAAYSTKSFLLASGLPFAGFLDIVAFNSIKDVFGGRLRYCINGGGHIAEDTQRFMSIAVAPMTSGYGLTETTG